MRTLAAGAGQGSNVNENQFEATTAERIAYNQERCRNARAVGVSEGVFLCECPDPMCRKTITLTLDEYVSVRSKPTEYLAALRHERIAESVAVAVRELGHYVVVERSRWHARGLGALARGAV